MWVHYLGCKIRMLIYNNLIIRSWSISDIDFTSTINNQLNLDSLLLFNDCDIDGLTFTRCRFSAPLSGGNGVSFWQLTKLMKNVNFIDCIFENIGRMGLEVLNRFTDKTIKGYSNINIINCIFNNLGLAKLYGMGSSFSGLGELVTVKDSFFSNILNIGVEGAFINSEVSGNSFNGFNANSTGISCTFNIQCMGNKFLNNIDTSIEKTKWNLWNQNGAIISGNQINNGQFYLRASNLCDINTNKINISLGNTIFFEGNSTGNSIKSNILNNKICFYGSSVTNNVMSNNIISDFVQYNGAINNTIELL